MVFMMPTTTIASRIVISNTEMPRTALIVQEKKGQLVLPAGHVELLAGPVLALTFSNFMKNG